MEEQFSLRMELRAAGLERGEVPPDEALRRARKSPLTWPLASVSRCLTPTLAVAHRA